MRSAFRRPLERGSLPRSIGWPYLLALFVPVVVALGSLSRLFTNSAFLLGPIAIATAMFVIALFASNVAGLGVQVLVTWASGVLGFAAMVSRVERRHPLLHDLRNAFRGVAHTLVDQQTRLEATPARQLAIGLFAVLIAGISLTAFASGARIAALLPSFGAFLIAAVLGSTEHRWWFTIGYIAAAGLWLAITAHQGSAAHSGWGRRASISLSLAVVSALVAGTATVLSQPPVWNWREAIDFDVPSTIRLDSLDSVSNWLRQRPQPLFTVTADRAEYWRMFALDTFDGSGWSVDATTAKSSSKPAAASDPKNEMVQQVTIQKLTSSELPAAYMPFRVRALAANQPPVLWMPTTQNFVLAQPTERGDRYEVRSVLGEHPDVVPPPASASAIDRRTSAAIRSAIAEIVDPAAPPETQLVQVQRWMRDGAFRYSIDAAFDPRSEAVINFLRTKNAIGFCQHFATAFALIARSLGLPARVAIGFRPGTATPISGGRSTFAVSTSMAHAWPEVYSAKRGWVPYEPTPGSASDPIRNPRDPNSLDLKPPPPAASSTSAVANASTSSRANPIPPSSTKPASGTSDPTTSVAASTEEGSNLLWPTVAAVLLLAAGVVLARARWKRRVMSEADTGLVLPTLWRQLRGRIDPTRARDRAHSTLHEEAQWMSAALAPADAETITSLANVIGASSFSDAPPDHQQAEQARYASEELLSRLAAEATTESGQGPHRRVRERAPS